MLTNALKFDVKHDLIGGVLFFLTHLVLVTGLSTILVHFMGMTGMVDGTVGTFLGGGGIHTLIGTFFVLWLGGSILHSRGLTNDIMSVIIVGVGLYLTYTSGIVLGLIPVALLTTIGKK